MFDVKSLLKAGVGSEKRVKRKKGLQSTAVRMFFLVLYVELCFCTGYILAHKKELDSRKMQDRVSYTQQDTIDRLGLYKEY